MTGAPYTVFGYKSKQVRDAIHSHELILAFDVFSRAPSVAEVYNIGGGRFSNTSVLEAIDLAQEIVGQ
jgi:CDP-paratose 2-epimerase